MTDVVQTVESVVGAIPAEAVTVAKEVIPVVETAVKAVENKVEEVAKVVETKVVETKVEAVVAPVVKTAAELALEMVTEASKTLEVAKKKAQEVKDSLKDELFIKKTEIEKELAKLELVFAQDAQVVATYIKDVVESPVSSLENAGKYIEATEAKFAQVHPVVFGVVMFVAGAIVSGLTVWGCL